MISGGARTRYRWKIDEDEVAGLLVTLGIEPRFVTPFHGQAKPIERAWNDLAEEVSKHPAMSGCYTGPGVHAKDYGYDTPIPQSDIDEAARQRQMKRSRYDPRAAAVEGITDQLDNDREVRAASIVQDPNNYDAGR